jgi:hypothetical protein
MPSIYHTNVEQGILAFGRRYDKFEKICGSNVPIHINHPIKRIVPILYHPDAHFVTKLGKLYVFEVLDSELNDENLIIADIMLACLCPNVSKVYFFVPKMKDQDKVMNLIVTVIDNLVSMGFNKKDPDFYAFYILKKEAKSPESVMEVLVRGAKEMDMTSKERKKMKTKSTPNPLPFSS